MTVGIVSAAADAIRAAIDSGRPHERKRCATGNAPLSRSVFTARMPPMKVLSVALISAPLPLAARTSRSSIGSGGGNLEARVKKLEDAEREVRRGARLPAEGLRPAEAAAAGRRRARSPRSDADLRRRHRADVKAGHVEGPATGAGHDCRSLGLCLPVLRAGQSARSRSWSRTTTARSASCSRTWSSTRRSRTRTSRAARPRSRASSAVQERVVGEGVRGPQDG